MMQYDSKMDIMDTSDHSWFEFFIDPKKAREILSDPKMKKHLPRLCIQFTEKGFLAEKEKDKAKIGVETANLFERKAASMRLCAMAAFAALDWDIDYIIDNISRYELLTLRILAEHSFKIYQDKSMDATFGNWLFYRFVLSIDRRNRLPSPAPKATVPTLYNQITTNDLSFIRHEKVQRMFAECAVHLLKARAFITELAEEPRDVIAPGVECFLQPFAKLAPKALNAALLGDRDVLIEMPTSDFEIEKIVLPAADVANKCQSELVAIHFTCGEYQEAKKLMTKLVKPKTSHPIVNIDEKVFNAYSMILNVKGDFASSTTIRNTVLDQKILADDSSIYRKSELFRDRAVQETSGQLKQVYQAENAAKSLADCHPECIREKIGTSAVLERFVKVLKRHLDGMSKDKKRQRIAIKAYLQFLCATVVDLKTMLERFGYETTELRDIAKPSPSGSVQANPTSEMIDALLQSADPFWQILTRFNLSILRDATVAMGVTPWFPTTMTTSKNLRDMFLTNTNAPNYVFQKLLLSKLEQLARTRNIDAFNSRLQEYLSEMNATPETLLKATIEVIHVRSAITNMTCNIPNERKIVPQLDRAGIIFKNEYSPDENSATIINHCMALLLNNGEFKMVLERGGHIPIELFPCVVVARLFGAYAQNPADPNLAKKCADGFSHTTTPKFIAAAQIRGAERKDLVHIVHLFEAIRQPVLVTFILGYVVSLFNRVLVHQKKLHLKIHSKFVFPNESTALEIQSTDDIRECLKTMCENAYAIMRTDPDVIRTYGDFLYAQGDYQSAGQKYLEYFAAHSPLLKSSASDQAVFVEPVLHRLRLSLGHAGYMTMSLLACQFMKTTKQAEYGKALAILRNNLTRDVGANCSEFVIDTQVIEMLSSVYYENRMTKSLTTLYSGASSLAANRNIPGSMIQQETNRRANKFLQALASLYFGIHVT